MQKSKLDRNLLIKNVLLNPQFSVNDLAPPFNFDALDQSIVDTATLSVGLTYSERDGRNH